MFLKASIKTFCWVEGGIYLNILPWQLLTHLLLISCIKVFSCSDPE